MVSPKRGAGADIIGWRIGAERAGRLRGANQSGVFER